MEAGLGLQHQVGCVLAGNPDPLPYRRVVRLDLEEDPHQSAHILVRRRVAVDQEVRDVGFPHHVAVLGHEAADGARQRLPPPALVLLHQAGDAVLDDLADALAGEPQQVADLGEGGPRGVQRAVAQLDDPPLPLLQAIEERLADLTKRGRLIVAPFRWADR